MKCTPYCVLIYTWPSVNRQVSNQNEMNFCVHMCIVDARNAALCKNKDADQFAEFHVQVNLSFNIQSTKSS